MTRIRLLITLVSLGAAIFHVPCTASGFPHLQDDPSLACPQGQTRFYDTCISTLTLIGQPGFGQTSPNQVTANSIDHAAGVVVDRSRRDRGLAIPDRLYVADTGNNRILGFRSLGWCSEDRSTPCSNDLDCTGECLLLLHACTDTGAICDDDDDCPGSSCQVRSKEADLVFGQPDAFSGACNGDDNIGQDGPPRRDTLCLFEMPRGSNKAEFSHRINLDVDSKGNLYVVDLFNNRALRFDDPFAEADGARGDNLPDFVWGQHGSYISRLTGVSRELMALPDELRVASATGISADPAGNVWIADPGNHRVLRFPAGSTQADLVIGQPNFTTDTPHCAASDRFGYNLCGPTVARVTPDGRELWVLDHNGGAVSSRLVIFEATQQTTSTCLTAPCYLPSRIRVPLVGGWLPTTSENLAEAAPAAQSSDFEGHTADKAVDGNTDGNLHHGSVTHTDFDDEAWWEVDLGASSYISSVVLWNRTDSWDERLRDFHVLVSEAPLTSTDLTATLAQPGVYAIRTNGAASPLTSVPVQRSGRHVRVQLSEPGFLQLAEVAVYSGTEVFQSTGFAFDPSHDPDDPGRRGFAWVNTLSANQALLIDRDGHGVVQVLNAAPDPAAPGKYLRGCDFARYDRCGQQAAQSDGRLTGDPVSYGLCWPGGSIGFDSDNNIFLADEIGMSVSRYRLPYDPFPNPSPIAGYETCLPAAAGGLAGPNVTSNARLAGSILGVSLFDRGDDPAARQLIARGVNHILVWQNYESAATVAGPASFVVETPGLDKNAFQAIDDHDPPRLWTTPSYGGALIAYDLPLQPDSVALVPFSRQFSSGIGRSFARLVWCDTGEPLGYSVDGIAFDHTRGALWISGDNRVMRIRNHGDITEAPLCVDKVIGQTNRVDTSCNRGTVASPDSLCLPKFIEFDRDGNLYVVENTYECHGNDRITLFPGDAIAATDTSESPTAETIFPDPPISAEKVFIWEDFNDQTGLCRNRSDGPRSPVTLAFDSSNRMIVGSDGEKGASTYPPQERVLRQLWFYRDPLARWSQHPANPALNGAYVQGQLPDALLRLPMGSAGELDVDSTDNLLIQDHTWSKAWLINLSHDPQWLWPLDNDQDGDGIRNWDDTCPYAYDPSNNDSDGDGTGDACGPTTSPTATPSHLPQATPTPTPTSPPPAGVLMLRRLVLAANTSSRIDHPRGAFRIDAVVDIREPFSALAARMQASGFSLRLTGAGSADETVSWSPQECEWRTTSHGPRARCRSNDRSLSSDLKPSRIPEAFELRVTAKRLDIAAPLSPSTVVATLAAADLRFQGSIGDPDSCRLRGRDNQRLDCRDRGIDALPTHTATVQGTSTATPTETPLATNVPPPSPTATPVVANVALGRTARQAEPTFEGHAAGKAVDGNTNGNLNLGSVTHTDFVSQAWWEVDLGESHAIQRVAVWNRTDCCSTRLKDFYLFVSNEPFVSESVAATVAQPGVSSHFHAGAAGILTEVPVSTTGRYVRVQLNATGFLQLAEVQIFAPGGD